jgi:hypothetical protein
MQGDTIFGRIISIKDTKLKIATTTSKLSFKPEEIFWVKYSKKQKYYTPSRMTAPTGLKKVPGVNPPIFRLSEIKAGRHPIFAEVITDGEIAIYLFEQSNTHFKAAHYGPGGFTGGTVGGPSRPKYFAVKKSTGEIIEIKKSGLLFETKKLKKNSTINIAKLMEDESEWLQKLEKEEKLTFDQFVDYIIGYNELRAARGYDAGRHNFQIF